MKEKILERIKKEKQLKNGYLEMLETRSKTYTEEYIIERIRECRIIIDALEEVLEGE